MICPTGRFSKGVSSPFYRNNSVLQKRKSPLLHHRPAPPRGRCATSSTRGGMRWTLRVRVTNVPEADGEVVWFWRPDAGAKVAGPVPADDGGKQARSPGRARRKPLKPSACGNAGLFRCIRGDYARVLCFILARETAGALGARHSPRPLLIEGGTKLQNSREKRARDRGGMSCVIVVSCLPPLRGALATKQSIFASVAWWDGLRALAMTVAGLFENSNPCGKAHARAT